MDYRIRRNKEDLDSTGYMEIGPGRYSGAHWQDGFLFVWEDAFGMAEGIVAKHFPAYDHFGMNDLPKEIGIKIVAEWREVAEKLKELSPEEGARLLNLAASYRSHLEEEIAQNCNAIAAMLEELSNECDRFYRQNEWVCVLGM